MMTIRSREQKLNSSVIADMIGGAQQFARIFNWVLVLIAASLILAILIINTNGGTLFVAILSACLPFLLIPYYLIRKQAFEWAAVSISIFFISIITLISTFGLGIHHIAILAYPAIIMVASLMTQKRTMVFIMLYNIACVAWLVFGELSGTYLPEVLEHSILVDFFSTSLALVFTAVVVRVVAAALTQSHSRLREELKERNLAEEKYRNIFDNAIDGIFQSTPDGHLISVNPAMASMYGYHSPQDMLESISDIASQIYINPEMRNTIRQRLEAGEQIKGYEAMEYRKDGSTLWTSMNAQVVRDINGQVLYYEGTVEDISERKKLKEERNNFLSLSIDMIGTAGTDGYFKQINPAFEKILGYDPSEFLSTPFFDFVHPDDLQSTLAEVDMLSHGMPTISFINRYKCKDGTYKWLEWNVTPVAESLYAIARDITESKKAQDALLQFRNLIDESNDSIFLIDPHTGLYLDFNRKAYEQLGYSREELLKISIVDVAQHIPNIENWHERAGLVRERGGFIFETDYKRKDGSIFPVEVSARILEYSNSSVVLAFVRDITERKKAEDILLENQKRLQAFFNQSLDGFFFTIFETPRAWDDTINKDEVLNNIFDTERYTEVNDAMLEQYDMEREKFLSLTSRDIFAHDIQQGLQLRRQLFDNGRLHMETFERKKNGSSVWFEGDYVCLYNEQKKVIGFFGIQRDITIRKQNEIERGLLIIELAAKSEESETLRKSLASIIDTVDFTEIIQRILDHIKHVIPYDSASVWVVEGDYQNFIAGRDLPTGVPIRIPLSEATSAAPLLAGDVAYVLSNNVQQDLQDFKEPPDDLINSWLAIPLKTRGNIIGFIALDGYQQEQFNDHHVTLALDFANQVAIALDNSRLFSDLQNELALRKDLIAELESKNTELERFTYTVSHDLKSPLVTINGFLGYLEKDIASGNTERVKKDRERIQDAVNKMYSLLNDLLELSRIGRIMNQPEAIEFQDLVNDSLLIVHGRLEANNITVHSQPNLPAIFGDRQRLTEALQNLLDNAAKFMGDQINPRIEIGRQGEENGNPIFYVRDNGIGIAPQYHELIFGLFNKLEAKGDSTGIGLALVKRIIEVHGGRIWVESEAGSGATFYFTLQYPV